MVQSSSHGETTHASLATTATYGLLCSAPSLHRKEHYNPPLCGCKASVLRQRINNAGRRFFAFVRRADLLAWAPSGLARKTDEQPRHPIMFPRSNRPHVLALIVLVCG